MGEVNKGADTGVKADLTVAVELTESVGAAPQLHHLLLLLLLGVLVDRWLLWLGLGGAAAASVLGGFGLRRLTRLLLDG